MMKLQLFCALFSLILIGSGFDKSQIESKYTDISSDNCKTVEVDEENAVSTQICEGVGGYKLLVIDHDARVTINVIDPKGKEHPLDMISKVSPAFSAIGEKAEWRVIKQGNTIKPIALIVRYNANERPDEPTKFVSYLTVSKITDNGICLVDKIKPSKTQNEEARKIADLSKTVNCL